MSLETRIIALAQAIGTDIKTLFGSKQDTLVPGVTLKTINGASLLGAGDLSVSGQASSRNIDGGSASTIFLSSQTINGGGANG